MPFSHIALRAMAAPTSVPACRSSTWRWELFLFGCVLAAYAPAFLTNYAMSDDYAFMNTLQSGHAIWVDHLQNGRPLYGLILQFAFVAAHGLSGLKYVRLAGVIMLGLAGQLAFRAQRSAGATPALAAATALALAATPASQVYAGWATASPFPLAVLLAGAAWWIQRSARSWVATSFAVTCLLAAFCIHQAAAMTFCGFWVADRFVRDFDARLSDELRAFAVLGSAALLNLVVIHIGVTLLHVAPSGRTSLALLGPAKLTWFVGEVLPNGLGLLTVHPSWGWWIAAGLFILSAIGSVPRPKRWRAAAFLLALVPLSYAPNLMAHESYASYRTLAGLSLVLVTTCVFGWAGGLRRLSLRAERVGLVLAGVGMLAFAGVQVARALIRPQVREYRSLRSQLEHAGAHQPICLIPARLQDAYSAVRYDEFGRPSTYADWSQAAAVRVVLRDLGKHTEGTDIELAPCAGGTELTINLHRS